MKQPIEIIAAFTCRAGTEDTVIAAVRECIAPSRAEAGCVKYEFYKDAEAERRFVFIETWQSEDAIDAHHKEPHFLTLIETLTPLLEDGFQVQKLHPMLGA